MIIAGRYSFKNGDDYIKKEFPLLLKEIESIIATIDAQKYKTKKSKEKTMMDRLLYNPKQLNKAYDEALQKLNWHKQKISCDYSKDQYVSDYKSKSIHKGAFREIDFVKEKLGIEIQFGKYAFMVYNVCAKMTIFHNHGFIDAGVEIVPIKQFADEMSTGVSYFEQFAWDLKNRGIADIDIPVLILGIDQ